MKKTLKHIMLLITCFTLLTCKKYDEGGWIRRTCKNLFGGNKMGDSKTWKLKKYEVNGIDSTHLINTGGVPDFYEKHVTFKNHSDKKSSTEFSCETSIYTNHGSISISQKSLLIGVAHIPFTKNDSTQCGTVVGSLYCARNLFFPELTIKTKTWYITKLTSNELRLECDEKNNYILIFVQ